MLLHKKAFYNLLKFNLKKIESGQIQIADLEPWQVENYREIPTDELFARLEVLDIHLSLKEFLAKANVFESPEELVEKIVKQKDVFAHDRLFLICFELWRRLLPEKRVLSIFCDELDHQIESLEESQDIDLEPLHDALASLQQLVEEYQDQGVEPRESLQLIQTFSAQNLETFFYDFILAQIRANQTEYASDLLEGFKKCFTHTLWFDYLEARLAILEEPEKGFKKLERLIFKIQQEPHLDLMLEILYFLAESGNHSLFHDLAIKTFPLLKIEADLQELMDTCLIHYEHLDVKEPLEALSLLFQQRKDLPINMPLQPTDPGLKALRRILEQRLQLASD